MLDILVRLFSPGADANSFPKKNSFRFDSEQLANLEHSRCFNFVLTLHTQLANAIEEAGVLFDVPAFLICSNTLQEPFERTDECRRLVIFIKAYPCSVVSRIPGWWKTFFEEIESTLIKRIMEFLGKLPSGKTAVYYCGKIKRDGEAQSKIKKGFL